MKLIIDETADPAKAEALAAQLNIPVSREADEALCLILSGDGLSLAQGDLQVRGDYSRKLSRLKHNNLSHEMLVKAAKLKGVEHPTALDATAGLGDDSLLLAAAGFTVELYEHNPIIWALLADTLERAAENPALAPIVSRMHLHRGNSVEAMKALTASPDIILLDPMFPPRQKSSLVTKKLQLFQKLEMPCAEESEILQAALSARPRRIVIKRPAKGPYLAGVKPAYSLDGSAVRYDCIVPGSTGD